MSYINFLRSPDAQRAVAAEVSGYHAFDGTLFLGYTTGAEPDHINYLRQVLAHGTLHRVRSVYYEGFNVPASDYEWNDATNVFFDRDKAHPEVTVINVKATQGLGTPIKSGGNTELAVVFAEGSLYPDFDSSGNQLDVLGNVVSAINEPLSPEHFFYTVNPAQVRTGGLLRRAPHVYNRYSWNWQKWRAYRDFCAGLETVDYRVIPNLKGFGLTARFFNSTDFTNEVTDAKRIDPYINFESSSGTPALGLTPASYSVRYEGFLNQKFTEQFTFTVQRNNTAKLWIDDVLVIDVGATTGTANLTADQFHKIRLDWVNSSGDGEMILKWSSTNTPEQIIKTDYYYPRVEQLPRYEAHVAFISPSSPAFTERLFDEITNCVTQKVNGKIVYECLEQKQITFELNETEHLVRDTNPDNAVLKLSYSRTGNDIQAQPADVYELVAGDLDDRYLNPFPVPVGYYKNPSNVPDNPIVRALVYHPQGSQSGFSVNMTRWQGFKILKYLMAREVIKDLKFPDVFVKDSAYPLQGGDVTRINIPSIGISNLPILITVSDDGSPEKENTRQLSYQEWFEPQDLQAELELAG